MEIGRQVSKEEGGGGDWRDSEPARSEGEAQLKRGVSGENREDGETRVTRGLESTARDELQRVSGDVSEAPAVVQFARNGGFKSAGSSPNSASWRGAPLLERVGFLETQMMALGMELNLSPRPHPVPPRKSMDKLRTAMSLLQETQTKGTLVERMQVLEDRFTAYMEKNDQALSIIQSKLALIDISNLNPERFGVHDAAEPPENSSDEEFHDADQESGSFESHDHQTRDQKPVEEAEVGADHKSGTVLPTPVEELQEASLVEEPQTALVMERSESVAPSVQSLGSPVQGGEENSGAAVAEGSSLTSTVSENAQDFHVKEPAAAAAQERAVGEGESDSVRAGPLTPSVEEGEPQNQRGGAEMDKYEQRESEYKAAEDLKVPDGKPGSFTRFITDPKLLQQGEKQKKEKNQGRGAEVKEKKGAEEKRQVGGAGKEKVKRKNSFRSDQEKSKQSFKQMRDRLRRAFKSNKNSEVSN